MDGFKIESISIEHVTAYTDKLARYKYPTKIIVEGLGTTADIKRAFTKFFKGEKTIRSGFKNSYLCKPGKMVVHRLGKNRFKIEALGSCEKALEEEIKAEEPFNLREVALKAFEAVFSDHESVNINGQDYFVERTSGAGLRYVKISRYTFLEQNPMKSSRWAKLANEGHKIMWVMDRQRYLA